MLAEFCSFAGLTPMQGVPVSPDIFFENYCKSKKAFAKNKDVIRAFLAPTAFIVVCPFSVCQQIR
jgi:hypothetical protein